MKVKALFFSAIFIVGLLMASCGAASKTCPAYSNADTEDLVEVNS